MEWTHSDRGRVWSFWVAYVDLRSAVVIALPQTWCSKKVSWIDAGTVAVFGLMTCALTGSRSSVEYIKAVLLPWTCFWLQ